jgi:hypothetical protein
VIVTNDGGQYPLYLAGTFYNSDMDLSANKDNMSVLDIDGLGVRSLKIPSCSKLKQLGMYQTNANSDIILESPMPELEEISIFNMGTPINLEKFSIIQCPKLRNLIIASATIKAGSTFPFDFSTRVSPLMRSVQFYEVAGVNKIGNVNLDQDGMIDVQDSPDLEIVGAIVGQNVEMVRFINNSNLSSVGSLQQLTFTDSEIRFSSCALTPSVVSQILIDLNFAGQENKTLNLIGGNNASYGQLSPEGYAAYNALDNKGWSISMN